MSDLNEWLKERRRISKATVWNTSNAMDAYDTLPALLTAVEAVLEQIEFMETDAENCLNSGHLHASEVLLENAGDLRQAIEGAINE